MLITMETQAAGGGEIISGTFSTQTTDFKVPLPGMPKFLYIEKKTGSYGYTYIYDGSITNGCKKQFINDLTNYDSRSTYIFNSGADSAGRGGLKAIENDGISWYTTSATGYVGDYIYWAVY